MRTVNVSLMWILVATFGALTAGTGVGSRSETKGNPDLVPKNGESQCPVDCH